MFFQPSRQVRRRPVVVPAAPRSQNINPSHKNNWCQGGELNSRPRAYESPALPLSYPGTENTLFCPDQPRHRMSGLSYPGTKGGVRLTRRLEISTVLYTSGFTKLPANQSAISLSKSAGNKPTASFERRRATTRGEWIRPTASRFGCLKNS